MDTRVRIKIEGGMVDVFHVPEGVTVEVLDYDVEGEAPEALDQYDQGDGTKAECLHYVIGRDGADGVCEYDSDRGWAEWLAGRLAAPTG